MDCTTAEKESMEGYRLLDMDIFGKLLVICYTLIVVKTNYMLLVTFQKGRAYQPWCQYNLSVVIQKVNIYFTSHTKARKGIE